MENGSKKGGANKESTRCGWTTPSNLPDQWPQWLGLRRASGSHCTLWQWISESISLGDTDFTYYACGEGVKNDLTTQCSELSGISIMLKLLMWGILVGLLECWFSVYMLLMCSEWVVNALFWDVALISNVIYLFFELHWAWFTMGR